ncbi:hypothetical protein SLA2020_326340 [Shorea laevis]
MVQFASYLLGSACFVFVLPFVGCSLYVEHVSTEESGNFKRIKENLHKLSPQMTSSIKVHGFLLWASLGFLMPLGILLIRMSNRSSEERGTRLRVLFYLHAILQIIAVLLATIGAVMSLRSFENSFNNSHQRLGLALYAAMWLQALIGFLKPARGSKRRSAWYLAHWILGTITSLVGIINIYTGLEAYHEKTSRGTRLWTILFTIQVSIIAFFYLLQDKWEYMQKQGLILGSTVESVTTASDQVIITTVQRDNQKVLLPQQCAKKNALRNLFD